MRITDYETNRNLNDVGLFLTSDEAAELAAYLQRLSSRPDIRHVHLSEVRGAHLEREITVVLSEPYAC